MSRYVKLVNGQEIAMTAEEIAERQAEEAIVQADPLNVILGQVIDQALAEYGAALPLGVPTQISILRSGLEDLAARTDEATFAREAVQAITTFPALGEPFESVRAALLSQIPVTEEP